MKIERSERNARLAELIDILKERGAVDRAELQSISERIHQVSWATARGYVDDLVRRGSAVVRFGIVRLRFEDEKAEESRIAADLQAHREAKIIRTESAGRGDTG